MGHMIIDGRKVEFTDEKNVLSVIRKAGINIPTLCYAFLTDSSGGYSGGYAGNYSGGYSSGQSYSSGSEDDQAKKLKYYYSALCKKNV